VTRPIDPPQETPPVFYSARQAVGHGLRQEQARIEEEGQEEQEEQERLERDHQTWLATSEGQQYLAYCKRIGVAP